MACTVFLYGTLQHPPLLAAVLGRLPPLHPATASGWRVMAAGSAARPTLVADASGVAQGVVLETAGTDRERLEFYLSAFGCAPRAIVVKTAAGAGEAVAFCAEAPSAAGHAWSLHEFVVQQAQLAVAAAQDYLTLWPQTPRRGAAAHYPQIVQRAASALRAGAKAAPRGVRSAPGAIHIDRLRRPYRAFFEVAEADLDFPRFGGGRSQTVTRAGFHMADAATVLPYDPLRDRVLVVEQFRFGPQLRGDPLPWTLEPIAGRIDGDESPEACVRREALEEAALPLGRLIPCGRYYPTPGAVSEYVFSFLGLADLPDTAAGVFGLAAEHEDICAHLLPFSQAQRMLDESQIETGPLLISLLQLARWRDKLRAEALSAARRG